MAGTQIVQETGEQKKTGSHWMEIRVRDFFFFFFSPGYTLKHILNSDSVLCFESPNNHTFFCALRFK